MSQGEAARAVRDAEREPVIVTNRNEPDVVMVSARRLFELGASVTDEAQLYQSVRRLLAVDLYQRDVLSLGRAAKFAGMPLADFIQFCGRMLVPVLAAPESGPGAEADAFEDWLESEQAGGT